MNLNANVGASGSNNWLNGCAFSYHSGHCGRNGKINEENGISQTYRWIT